MLLKKNSVPRKLPGACRSPACRLQLQQFVLEALFLLRCAEWLFQHVGQHVGQASGGIESGMSKVESDVSSAISDGKEKLEGSSSMASSSSAAAAAAAADEWATRLVNAANPCRKIFL